MIHEGRAQSLLIYLRRKEDEIISMITSITFTVYPVSHMERARAFYEHVLGLHVSDNYRDMWVE